MKVLHISLYSWEAGGLSKFVFDHALCQTKAGCEVTILTVLKPHEKLYDIPTGVNVMVCKPHFLARFFPSFSTDLSSFLAKSAHTFDIIHVHGIFHYGSVAPFFYARKTPILVTIHGMLEPWSLRQGRLKKQLFSTLIQKRLLRKASVVHALHEQEKRDILSYMDELNNRMIVLPNGIDLGFWENKMAQSWADWYPEKRKLLFLSRLNVKKGLDLLLSAFQRFSQENDDTLLLIAGPDDGYEATLREFVVANKLTDRILCVGMLVGDDKLRAFAKADAFVLPSYSEGFSIVVLEALAAKLPILVSENTGFSDEIRSWNAGYITELSVDEVYDGIKAMFDSESLRNNLKNNGFEMVKQQYSLDSIAHKLIEQYKKMLSLSV